LTRKGAQLIEVIDVNLTTDIDRRDWQLIGVREIWRARMIVARRRSAKRGTRFQVIHGLALLDLVFFAQLPQGRRPRSVLD
jgi:hypothetical protein